ncbi:MAG: MogA/MoaB family molybdenum cofactor biosynthesis protein [Acidobacteria bacterium]|nr:MogA/MoaB family molybdenum cofactor biosynthesis protein [Acidobacteriota bacterium]
MPSTLRAHILVLSDAASRGEREDHSGPAVRRLLEAHGWMVAAIEILPDEYGEIRDRLVLLAERDECDGIFTTGGTGVAFRDVTPDATRAVIEREIPGLAELMRAEGLKKTRKAVLSRAVCGVRKQTIIVNLPGSPQGAAESLESIIDLLPHVVDLMKGKTEH